MGALESRRDIKKLLIITNKKYHKIKEKNLDKFGEFLSSIIDLNETVTKGAIWFYPRYGSTRQNLPTKITVARKMGFEKVEIWIRHKIDNGSRS